MTNNDRYIIGIMSGTSLDGLDIALCHFTKHDKNQNFNLLAAKTIEYDNDWKEKLSSVHNYSALEYFKLNQQFGAFIGTQINLFLSETNLKANYIASHGHTVFHQPYLGFTTQMGCGATIAASTGLTTICDFRSLDVALKGQGAPLVPIGDRDLFNQYESCLNIGGIANISFTKNTYTEAFDICIANMALNYLAEEKGKKYDDGGKLASSGKINQQLLNIFLSKQTQQKSLGREWFETNILPELISTTISTEDKLATCAEYTAIQIADCLNKNNLSSVLVTGGGAFNSFLINRLKKHYSGKVEIPSNDIVQFKEAIIFAYLGFLRINNEANCLSSVTKSIKDNIGGCIYQI